MKIWKLRFDSDRYASLKPVPLCTIDEVRCLEDVAVALGCLFGFAIVKKYGWNWKAVGQSKEDATFCVVLPDNKLVHPCMKYI